MTYFGHDLRHALRSLLRQPGFTLAAAGTLALGIGATTAIFTVVNAVLLQALPFPHAERIVTLWQRDKAKERRIELGMVSSANLRDWRAGASSLETLAQFRSANVTWSSDGGADLIAGAEVSSAFFHVFGIEPVLGRPFTEAETQPNGPRVAVISQGLWQERLGGSRDVIGRTIQLQGAAYEVVGVVPATFEFPYQTRIWLPIQRDETSCGRGCVQYAAVGLLRAGATVEQARAEASAVAQRLEREYPQENAGITADVAALREVLVGDVKSALLIVFGAVFMVLLIACANVANLLLIRAAGRRTEIAVRAALGAGRRRLLSQLITESALIATLGSVCGALLASWGVELLPHVAPSQFPRLAEIGVSAHTLLFAVLLGLFTTLLFGLTPALQLSAAPFAATLRESGRGAARGHQRGRAWILGAEVALSVTLLLGAGLMLRSVARMRAVEPGFDSAGVTHLRVSLPAARYPDPGQAVTFVQRVQERLAAEPGVERAGYIVGLPMSGINVFGGFARLDQPPPDAGHTPVAAYRAIDPHYLAVLRVPLLAGRNFTASDDARAMPVVIINERLAQLHFGGENPVGKQIDVQVSIGYPDTLPRTIVGVIRSARARSLRQEPEPALYVPAAQSGGRFGHFVIRSTRSADEVLSAARTIVAAVDPQIPLIQPGPMDDLLAEDRAQHTFYLQLLGLFAVLAITLAAVGMYGVVAYGVAQRTREIGVRMALGARARQVVSLVVWQGLRPALAGAVIGVAGAHAAADIIAGLLYQVEPQDPVTLAGVAAVLLCVVACACSIPALRATRIPPSTALQSDT